MPLYEYRCGGCSERFEVLQRLGAGNEDVLCPSCGTEKPERVLSTFAAGGAREGSSATCDAGTACCRGASFS
ncbi:MAG TPA: zinc ribbon domain-containing protein [Thermoanaerobaculia bacterium]|nr:zinc ribbon domain-containing protein [Thermoanaerobaculia bacterium]